MTGFLKNRLLHGQAQKAFVRRGRGLLGNFPQFSIIEKLRVPGAFGGCCTTLWGQDWSGDPEGSVQDGINTRKKKRLEKQSGLKRKWLNVSEGSGVGPQASKPLSWGRMTGDSWEAGTVQAQGLGLIRRADIPSPPRSRSPSSLFPTFPHHRDPQPSPSNGWR